MTEEELKHYGVARRSGRYPWGSGEDPQRSQDLLNRIDDLRSKGHDEKSLASELGMNTTELRNAIAWANNDRKQAIMDSVQSRKKRGESNTSIARDLGISEGSVRNYLSSSDKVVEKQLDNITQSLKVSVGEKEYLDIGVGVERQMGISRAKMKAAVSKLKEEGYYEHDIYVRRLTDPSKYTTVRVLTKEKDLEVVKANSDKIRPVDSYTDDGGLNMKKTGPVEHLDWKRVDIRYAEDGGTDKDGVIELRRNVKDLDMGGANYAQVRIAVGEDRYLKGMAMYSDDMPKGKDIVFNTNKPKGTPKEKVLKEMKKRPDGTINDDNPFGATIKPRGKRGALNIVNEEGDWAGWKSSLSSQFLSKQPNRLVKERLDATFGKLKDNFDEIDSLTNPAVKKYLLDAYIDGLDSKTQHLKAEGLPKTAGHVLLPFPKMKPNEVYAPNYNDGDKVVLIRYPHGGIFEIPELRVNNKGPAKGIIKNAVDAIGIHPSVASKLSGADFDGDTVYVIPNNHGKIKSSRSLAGLRDFDPNKYAVDHVTISPKRKQTQMGVVSNLITDMTIKGAGPDELARAVRHSMVVIDSEKHKLDYKQSARDNGIAALQKKYQSHISPTTGKARKGASTLISRSKRKDRETKSALIDDVFKAKGSVKSLSSGTTVENLYVDYIDRVKQMQNKARAKAEKIPPIKKDPKVAARYKQEVASLDKKLDTALLNAPKERQAQLLASNYYYRNLDYDMDKDQKKKLKAQSLVYGREKANSGKQLVDITPDEWKAIQAGAISNNKLLLILKNSDLDKVKAMATPRTTTKLSSAKLTRAQGLLDKGYTYAEVAGNMGVSVSTLRNELKGE